MNLTVSDLFTAAQSWLQRKDPLTLDLDNDGLETVGTNAGILFDHDGDGTKNGTGWVKADDGFLVLDRNGNGQIDNGAELFGDSTPLEAGGAAADGFAALAQEDTNHDGLVNSADARWSQLRVWQDANQNGISEANELKTLSSLGIAAFRTAATDNNHILADGNRIADLGSFIRTDGSGGAVGQMGGMADIDLVADTFHRSFADSIPVSEAARPLPEMQGSGVLRDLKEAASQSGQLAGVLAQYAGATTRQAQHGLIDGLLGAWAETGGLLATLDDRDPTHYLIRYESFGSVSRATYYHPRTAESGGGDGGGAAAPYLDPTRDVDNPEIEESYRNLIAEWNRKIHITEAFNGRYFFNLPNPGPDEPFGAKAGMEVLATFTPGPGIGGGGGGDIKPRDLDPKILRIGYTQAQLTLLESSYQSIKASVYDGLLLQTRFKPLLDLVELSIDETGIHLDYSQLERTFWEKVAANEVEGLADLIEFNRATLDMIPASAWNGERMMESLIRELPRTPELLAMFADLGVHAEGSLTADLRNEDTSEYLAGGMGNDTVYGFGGKDWMLGGGGNDYLFGDQGDDVLDGVSWRARARGFNPQWELGRSVGRAAA